MLRPTFRAACRQSRCIKRTTPRITPLRTLSTTSYRMSSSAIPPVEHPISSALPSDSFQLLPTEKKAGDAEDALYNAQVQALKEWWESPRFKGIKRPYTAEDVVARRGTLQQTYPSSLMARKLFNLLEERAAEGKPVHTSEFTQFLYPSQLQFPSFFDDVLTQWYSGCY
jgi:isocitrate lyase